MRWLPAAGLLFDCDGVLVDSDPAVTSAWSRWAREHDLDPDTVVAVVHGRRATDTVAALIPAERRSAALARINQLEVDSASGVRAIPGAAKLLGALPTGCWAIVTSGLRALALARLRAAGLPVPDVLITADTVAHGKPHPEGYLAAAQGLGLLPADCVVFEDAPDGIAAGRAAGVGAVVGIGDRISACAPDARLADLSDLTWCAGELQLATG